MKQSIGKQKTFQYIDYCWPYRLAYQKPVMDWFSIRITAQNTTQDFPIPILDSSRKNKIAHTNARFANKTVRSKHQHHSHQKQYENCKMFRPHSITIDVTNSNFFTYRHRNAYKCLTSHTSPCSVVQNA